MNSRDAGRLPGASGSDGISATSFAARLDPNIAMICERIRDGHFGFSALRPVPIPKPNSDKLRIVCIPTVGDRLVQRVIAAHLTKNNVLKTRNSVSFAFEQEKGVSAALRRCLALRNEHKYVFETDILGFFDNVDRRRLIEKLSLKVKNSGIFDLLGSVVRSELQIKTPHNAVISKAGLKRGQGIRQGMPLSPLLSNFVLADFDRRVEKAQIPVVRYADDIVAFANRKSDIIFISKFIREILHENGFEIPQLSEDGKTKICGYQAPFSFLGREFYFHSGESGYRQRISMRQIEKIKERIKEEFDLRKALERGTDFPSFATALSRTINSYLYAYKGIANEQFFDDQMREITRSSIQRVYIEMFGKEAVDKLSEKRRAFLGIRAQIGTSRDMVRLSKEAVMPIERLFDA